MKRFNVVSNGYDVDEVNRFIDIVIKRLEKLNAENKEYALEVDILNKKLEESNNRVVAPPVSDGEDKISKAILAVQESADKIINASKKESEDIIAEAKRNASSIVHEALVEAEKIEYKAMIMKKNLTVYKTKLKSLLEAQMEITEEMDQVEVKEQKNYHIQW